MSTTPPFLDQLNAAIDASVSSHTQAEHDFRVANQKYKQISPLDITPQGITGTLTGWVDEYVSEDGNQPGLVAMFRYMDTDDNVWMKGINFVVTSNAENWRTFDWTNQRTPLG